MMLGATEFNALSERVDGLHVLLSEMRKEERQAIGRLFNLGAQRHAVDDFYQHHAEHSLSMMLYSSVFVHMRARQLAGDLALDINVHNVAVKAMAEWLAGNRHENGSFMIENWMDMTVAQRNENGINGYQTRKDYARLYQGEEGAGGMSPAVAGGPDDAGYSASEFSTGQEYPPICPKTGKPWTLDDVPVGMVADTDHQGVILGVEPKPRFEDTIAKYTGLLVGSTMAISKATTDVSMGLGDSAGAMRQAGDNMLGAGDTFHTRMNSPPPAGQMPPGQGQYTSPQGPGYQYQQPSIPVPSYRCINSNCGRDTGGAGFCPHCGTSQRTQS